MRSGVRWAAVLKFAWLAGCGSEAPTIRVVEPETDPVVEIRIVVPSRGVPGLGGTLQARAEAVGRSGAAWTLTDVTWSSEDPTILSVDSSGLATGHAEGSTWIRATFGDLVARERLWVVRDVSGEVAFVGATVLAMDGGPPRADQTVLVNGTTIQTVGDRTSIPVPDGAEVVEAQGLFLIPGLTDAHAHPRTEQDLLPYLANGVTTIVSLGHPEFAPVLEWRDRIAAGSLLGPTIYATGRILDGTNPRGTATLVADPEAGRRAVRAQAAAGVDFIKVYNGLSVATFNAIMDQARTEGLAVVGHGVRAPGFEGILDAGVAAIAHAEEIYYTHFRSTVDPSLVSSAVERIASAGAWVMPNLSTFERVVLQWGNTAALHQWVASPENRFLHPNHTQNWFTFHQNAYANRTGSLRPVLGLLTTLTGALHEAGVPLLLASDSPIIPGLYPGFSIHEDLRLLTAAGLTAQEALEVGTVNGGRFIAEHHRSDDVFGTISAGQRADLVLVAGDPTVDLGVLRSPRGVMVRGRFLSGPRLEQLLEDLARGMGND